MTVESTGPRINYVASGGTVFAYNWLCQASGDMVVYDNGSLVGSSSYTVSGVGVPTGGNVTFSVAPTSGHVVVLMSGASYTQPVNVDGGTTISLTALEDMADRQTVLIKQVEEITDRALKFPPYSCSSGVIVAEPETGRFLRWEDATHVGNADITATGALGLPVSFANGGTNASYASALALARGLNLALWKAGAALTAASTLSLPDPIDGNVFDVNGSTGITAISTTGIVDGTVIWLRITNTPTFTDSSSLQLFGRRNFTATGGETMVFQYASAWREIIRTPAHSTTNAGKFWRGDGAWSTASIGGMALSNNAGDATNDIDISVGARWSDDSTHSYINLTSALTKRLDAVWAVGTNQGMLASGAALTNTTYHLFVIMRPDTGVVDVAADSSASGANLAANTDAAYTRKWRIGSILREGGTIVGFVQNRALFQRKAAILDVNATNPGTSAVTRTLSVPLGIQVFARVNAVVDGGGVLAHCYLSDLAVTDEAASSSAAPLAQIGQALSNETSAGLIEIMTNTSGQIRSRLAASDGTTELRIATLGWFDWDSQG